MKKLLIFPGSGSPEHHTYREVYALLEDGALKYGYEKTHLCLWPGQKKSEPGVLTLDGAVKVAREKIAEMESEEGEYSILGRSFGTIVAAKVLTEMQPVKLKRVIMWGPPPFSILWKLFKPEIISSIKTLDEKGTRINTDFFESIIPFETLIPSVRCKAVVATGTEDKWSPPEFISYIHRLVKDKENFIFRNVEGALHECTKKDSTANVQVEYLQKLLDDDYRD